MWGERQLHNIADRTRSHPLDGDLAVAVGGKSTKASAIHARETPPTKGTRVPEVGARFSIETETSTNLLSFRGGIQRWLGQCTSPAPTGTRRCDI